VSTFLRSTLVVSLLATAVAGCAVGPDYKRPKVPTTPEGFRSAPTPKSGDKGATLAELPWWKLFGDDALIHLVEQAGKSNFDIRIAAQRIEVARAQARAAGAQVMPEVGAMVGAGAGQGQLGYPAFTPVQTLTAYNAGFTLNWELDVWGRIRRNAEAAQAEYLATVEEQRGVWITLLADIATTYFQLLSYDEQVKVSVANADIRKATLDLFQTRAAGGVGSDLEVARAEADYYDAIATTASSEQAVVLAENQLSLLTGRAPGPVERGHSLDEQTSAIDVPPGLPSTLLERRPDVRSSEASMIAANARVGVANANFYPKFNLTGTLGGITNDLTKMSTQAWPVYTAAGSVDILTPILAGSRLSRELEAAKAQWEASKANYERVATTAFKEVADALVRIEKLRARREQREKQVASLARALDVANARYQGGTSTYLEVLYAQEPLLPAQLGLAQLKAEQLEAFVSLYRALGGGWHVGAATTTPKKGDAPQPLPIQAEPKK
jgi:multidrug efflux system outer membrane protein